MRETAHETVRHPWSSAMVILAAAAGTTLASVGDIASFVDAPRTYNDFPSSTLAFSSAYADPDASVSIHEQDYGSGNFANRHMAWFGDAGASKVDFDYGDAFDASLVMTVRKADAVGNVAELATANLFMAKDGVVHTPVPNSEIDSAEASSR